MIYFSSCWRFHTRELSGIDINYGRELGAYKGGYDIPIRERVSWNFEYLSLFLNIKLFQCMIVEKKKFLHLLAFISTQISCCFSI